MDQRESRQRRIALSGIILAVTVCFLGCGKNTTDHSTITHAVDEHEATANAAVGAAFRSSESTEVIGELRRLLREGDDRTRVGALRALKMCGDNALPAAPELVALLANPYASLSPEAQSLLMSFGVRAPDVTPELIQIAEDGPEWARYRAIMVLRFQDDAANRVIPVLRQAALKSENLEVRKTAVQSLMFRAAHGDAPEQVIAVLEQTARDPDQEIQMWSQTFIREYPFAKQIVDRMAKAYSDCKSYRDTGGVKTLFVDQGNGNRTVERLFTTAFVRPDRFRFEFKDSGNANMQGRRYIVWSNGKNVQTWWDIKPGIETPESLNLAVAGATGVSGSSAHTIPALLLPDEVGGRKLTDITELKRTEDGAVANVECFRVAGKFGDESITVWIDKQSYLVRRIDEQHMLGNIRVEQTTTYEPSFVEKITDKMLEFDPPG